MLNYMKAINDAKVHYQYIVSLQFDVQKMHKTYYNIEHKTHSGEFDVQNMLYIDHKTHAQEFDVQEVMHRAQNVHSRI